jgi:hypothetical protein
METSPATPDPEYCGAFPGLSAAGTRLPCTPGECPTERICHALKRLERESERERARAPLLAEQGPVAVG